MQQLILFDTTSRADITLEILRGTFVIMSPSPNIGGACPPCPIWIDALGATVPTAKTAKRFESQKTMTMFEFVARVSQNVWQIGALTTRKPTKYSGASIYII